MMPNAGFSDEQIMYKIEPVKQKRLRLGLFIIGLIFFLIPGLIVFIAEIASGRINDALNGLIVIFIGIIIILVSIRRDKMKGIKYIITNKRALVIKEDRSGQKILQECNLANSTPIIQGKQFIGQSYVHIFSRKAESIGINVGNVVFMEGTTYKVNFMNVPDPDGIVSIVEQIKKSIHT
ncbi:MAG: hypothetical protein GPW19_00515 [Euryarchaeota archaeon]|jgi:hypothetical protein|nr:hypothetical protein [Euryarchaeota archaeon]